MTLQCIAVASAKSFGDFVIAHSVLQRVADRSKHRTRLIALSHLKALNATLPDGVDVTLLESGENRVPAIFDIKKCGMLAAAKSAWSLRRRLQTINKRGEEILVFDALGVRERFIAGNWSAAGPRDRGPNIYETFARFLADWDIVVKEPAYRRTSGAAMTVGIFPESRLVHKRLSAPTLSLIVACVARAGLNAKIFILDGDTSTSANSPNIVTIPRDFESLAAAIRSVDYVISADSLPAHLGEYFARPVFVASPARNTYWLPHGCFTHDRWGIFGDDARLAAQLRDFFTDCQPPETLRETRPVSA